MDRTRETRRRTNSAGRRKKRRRRDENRKVIPYKKGFQFNLGIVAFILILIYVIAACKSYFDKPRISVYEVQQKKLSDSYKCTGLVLRNEKIETTSNEGYLNYYYADGSKIAKNSVVYTLDKTGEVYDLLRNSEKGTSLSKSDRKLLWTDIEDFRNQYTNSKYSSVSDFAYNVENTVLELSASSMSENVQKILDDNQLTGGYSTVSSNDTGLITYSMDGYEEKKVKDITIKDFNSSKYEKTQLRTNEKVDKGAPVYKMITGEDWTIVVDLSEDLYKQLKQRVAEDKKKGNADSYLSMTLLKENISMKKAYKLEEKDGGYFAIINMDNYIVHYLDNRFISLEVSLESMQGLKIPTTSILNKNFYLVPQEYFTVGGNGDKPGLVKEIYDKSGELSYKFVQCDSCYVDEDGMAYVDKSLFSSGEWIRNQENQERYQIGVTKKLKGVYNVNLGYCIFKRIEILYRNEEYCIVKPTTENGLSTYDHIIVDSSTVSEDDLINNYKGE